MPRAGVPERFSIFGADGLVGSRLVARLHAEGVRCDAYGRRHWPKPGADLGRAIYAIGVTADFRSRPLDTVEAHVGRLADLLRGHTFDSFVYLSSTRVYRGAASTDEDAPLIMAPADPDRLYDLSKLLGECLALFGRDPRVRIARLSNVCAAGDRSATFLASVLRDAAETGHVRLGQTLRSCKDYVAVDDAVDALVRIARFGRQAIYNVASGETVTHGEIADWLLRQHQVTTDVADDATDAIQPRIAVARLRDELGWQPKLLVDQLGALYAAHRERHRHDA